MKRKYVWLINTCLDSLLFIFLFMFAWWWLASKSRDRTRVEEDFRKAVQLDHNSVKARLFFYYWHCMRSFLLLPSYGGLHVCSVAGTLHARHHLSLLLHWSLYFSFKFLFLKVWSFKFFLLGGEVRSYNAWETGPIKTGSKSGYQRGSGCVSRETRLGLQSGFLIQMRLNIHTMKRKRDWV